LNVGISKSGGENRTRVDLRHRECPNAKLRRSQRA
jgi:hypothetical protein